jgi:hypothetical protein
MTPTKLAEAEQARLRDYEALAEAYHAKCLDATTYADVRAADDQYWREYDALTRQYEYWREYDALTRQRA